MKKYGVNLRFAVNAKLFRLFFVLRYRKKRVVLRKMSAKKPFCC